MEQQLETPVKISLSASVLQKMIEWSNRTERRVIKSDVVFWTSEHYYLLQCLKLQDWMKQIEESPQKDILITVSSQVSILIAWFIKRYAKKS